METREWTVLLEEIDRRDYQMIIMGWIKDPGLDDFKQLWHTDSYKNAGSNFVGFGDAESDALIDSIRGELDETKRNAMYQSFKPSFTENVIHFPLVREQEVNYKQAL